MKKEGNKRKGDSRQKRKEGLRKPHLVLDGLTTKDIR